MTSTYKSKLSKALRDKLLVKSWSPYESGSTQGYVLGIGPLFFLIGILECDCRLNGFQCLLISDVRRLRVPDPQAKFITEALRIRGQSIGNKPDIDLSNVTALLKSASLLFPLVAIHRERINPDTCKIGKMMDVDDTRLRILEIGPDAIWEKKPTKVRLSDITRIDFGGGYEEALHLVGGDPLTPSQA